MGLDEMAAYLERASLGNYLPSEISWAIRRLVRNWRSIRTQNERLKAQIKVTTQQGSPESDQ